MDSETNHLKCAKYATLRNTNLRNSMKNTD